MRTAAIAALVVAAGNLPASAAEPPPGRTEVVSVATDGTLANNHSAVPAMSADGRFVAFPSRADNLVPDKTNLCGPVLCQDIFVHDRESGTTERVSVATGGAEANGDSALPSISADGRYVAFYSWADNLAPGVTNDTFDVFVHDRQTGVTERISVTSDGGEANGQSSNPSMSADGRRVAFTSYASNLVPDDTNGFADIFVHDRESGTTERVSVASDGAEGNHNSLTPAISADGRAVAFMSHASNLVAADTNGATDIFVHDREAGTTERVSVASDGAQANFHSFQPSVSADGRSVAFTSNAQNLVPDGTGGGAYVHDRETGITERVSVASDGTKGHTGPSQAHLSADGRYVAFRSASDGRQDVFVHDRATRATERVSVASDGTEGSRHATVPALSADGRYTMFRSSSPELLAEPNECPSVFGPQPCDHVFVRDRGPATGVGDLAVAHVEGGVHVSGWARFAGQVVASASDPPDDGAPLAEEAGAELTAASLTHRPAQEDLLVRLQLASLPGERCIVPAQPGTILPFVCERGGGAPGVLAPGVLHRRVIYALGFELEGTPYEVRARSGSMLRTSEGTESDDPHFALYRCDPDCAEQAELTGGIGITGYEVTVSVPMSVLGASEEAALTQIRAWTSWEEFAVLDRETLDEVDLPDATIPAAGVSLGIAPAGTPEQAVVFDVDADLIEGGFSGSLDAASLPAGEYRVWARACLGEICGSAWVTVER